MILGEALLTMLLDEIGAELSAQGITLEELMETGREIRGALLQELYGIQADEETDL